MQYEIINDRADFTKPLETIFDNRGVPFELMERMLHPTRKEEHDFRLLQNIIECAERIIEAIKNEEKIFLQVDSDADGYTSAALTWMMLVYFGAREENIIYRMHDGKQHGIIVETVPDDCTLVVIPDAGSNQYKEHKELKEKGKTVLVMDHHEADKLSEDAIVVNNQFGYPNKSLSGVGVVYKVFQALEYLQAEQMDGEEVSPHFLDVVAVGLVADMMDVSNLETMYYVQEGMANINNPFFRAIVDGNSFKLSGDMSPMKISFYIAPLINGMVRTGTQEQKHIMFNAMIKGDEIDMGENTGFGEGIPYAKTALKVCASVKRKQDKFRDEGMVKMHIKIKKKGLDKNKIIVGNAFGIDPNLRGLIANQLMAAFKKPVLMLAKDSKTKIWSGSGRGADKSDFKDFKDYLNSTGLFEYAEGHQSAFGAAIKDENMEKFIEQSNKDLEKYSFSKSYKVDLEYTSSQINPDVLAKITAFNNHYSKGFEEPYLLIKNVRVTEDSLSVMGKNPDKPSVRIKVGDINFVIFNTTKEKVEELKQMKYINVIGRANENVWMDETSYQIMITDYEKAVVLERNLF